MTYIILCIIGLLAGITASLGIGGGFVLLIYLTAIANMPQLEAQLINLIFFIPIALISVFLHNKNKLIEKSIVIKSVAGGILGVFFGAFLSTLLPNEILSKIWAVFIMLLGIRELFKKEKQQAKKCLL